MDTLNYCYDLEFLENGRTIDLISIGIVCEDGREYYAVNSDMPVMEISEHDWLCRNVVPHLPLKNPEDVAEQIAETHRFYSMAEQYGVRLQFALDTTNSLVKPGFVIANEVRDFMTLPDESRKPTVEIALWAYCGAWDHVCLNQLYGPMNCQPAGFPYYTNDLASYRKWLDSPWIPPQPSSGAHNALEDARYNMVVWKTLRARDEWRRELLTPPFPATS